MVYADLTLDAVNTLHEDGASTANVVAGCTYAVACNFNPAATEDDGTCDWSCACGEGTVWDDEAGSCVATCTADHNGDGAIGAGDLIIFLTLFGVSCP